LTDWHHTVASVRLHWIIGINRANHPRPEFFALSSYLYHLLMRSRASAIVKDYQMPANEQRLTD
jgi:hypothetical protein